MKVKVFILICLFLAVTLSACTPSTSDTISNSQEKVDMEKLYEIQNYPLTSTHFGYYLPSYEENQNYVYERLFYYRQQTDATLSFEDVQEYLSSEHEEDGNVRIYNNGNWTEIEQYVDWYWEHEDEYWKFHDEVMDKKAEWASEYPFLWGEFHELSLHNLNEILLTMQDESYVPSFK